MIVYWVTHNIAYQPVIIIMNSLVRLLPRRFISHRPAFSFSQLHKTLAQETGEQAIAKNFGLSRFIRKTYLYTGGSVVASLLSANVVNSYFPGQEGLAFGGAIAGVIGIVAASYMSPTYQQQRIEGIQCKVAKDSFLRRALFWSGVIGMGMGMAPLIRMADFVDPNILTRALMATSATFAAVSIVSLRMPKSAMLRYGSILGAGLLSLIALQLAGLGATYLYGANQFSQMVHQVDLYGGIGLFTLYIAYDTHQAIKMYEQGQPDHLGISLQLYLDFMSILRRIIMIMIHRKSE